MSKLEEIRNKKTQKDRILGLTEFLNTNEVGHLSEVESIQFRHIFQQFYTPDEGEDKFDNEEIQAVGITKDPRFGNKCFCIYLKRDPDKAILCGKMSLAGAKRNPKQTVAQAARFVIQDQIQEFRNEIQKKNCPGCNEKLGSDAQVDHHVPTFQELLNGFCDENKLHLSKINIIYNEELYKREFKDSNISTNWSEYHKINANLRWLCKKCNKSSKIANQI